jgi:hypothetical protein
MPPQHCTLLVDRQAYPFQSTLFVKGSKRIVSHRSTFATVDLPHPTFSINSPSHNGNIAFIADGDVGIGQSNTGDYLMLVDPTSKVFDSLSHGDDDTKNRLHA